MIHRITYTIKCDDIYYVDIEANTKEEAIELFNSGYWDIEDQELVDSSCLDPEIEDISIVEDE